MTEAESRPAEPPTVKIGVLLPYPPDELGEWLADAAAFEAAGADALWIDPGQSLDPLTLAAALAALTYRAQLVTALQDGVAEPRALATVRRLSRRRIALSTGAAGWPALAAQEAELTIFRPADSAAGNFLSVPEGESWASVPPPAGRAAWRTTLAEAVERGDAGLLVPADPRLLDILRNPGDPGGRQDLQLAQG
jgi:hypothetical protein